MTLFVQSHTDKKLETELEKTIPEFNNFFAMNWEHKRPEIYIVKDREAIDRLQGYATPNWIVGWSSGKDIYMLDKDSLESESSHKYTEKTYLARLRHELVHCFCNVLYGHNRFPRWISEGLAVYLSGQSEMWDKPCEYKKFLDWNEKSDGNSYGESGFAVKHLIEEYGKEKFLELIGSIREDTPNEQIKEKFGSIYNIKLKYENFK